MAVQEYIINYIDIPGVSFPSKTGAKKYLEAEKSIWLPFFESIIVYNQPSTIPTRKFNGTYEFLANSFQILISHLNDPVQFNRTTTSHFASSFPPPPSSSLEGQLILGLLSNNRLNDAVCVYLWFLKKALDYNNYHEAFKHQLERGETLAAGGYAAAALPFQTVTSQRLKGVLRKADAQVKSLSVEVKSAQETNYGHAEKLSDFRATWKRRAKRIESVIISRERNRRTKQASWIDEIKQEVNRRFEQAEIRLDALDRVNKAKQKTHQEEFDRLLALFHEQLKLRAPVKLWERRAEQHGTKSKNTLISFIAITLLAILAGALIPYCFGDYIAESFFTQVCDNADQQACKREFSAKGPLTVAGILTIMSLIMWAIRLQYRVYLSERHLALDASEKQAFAETYLAMKEGEHVGSDNEAIVLASLFRPTQDGIIKDDDSALDLSMAAMLAKQLGRGGP